MANDEDMWNDMSEMDKRTTKYRILCQCFSAKYVEFDDYAAEKWKEVYITMFGYWDNYY